MATDFHKGILGIKYNSLNLPYELLIKNTEVSGKVYYTYSASGAKLKTKHMKAQNLGYTPVTGTAGDTNLDVAKTTDYVGNKVYEDGMLKRVLVDGGYIEGGVYHYYLNDHLGNNRMTVNQNGVKTQWNHYYPFGMAFADKYDNGTNQPYKYNGKELDPMYGLNLYDYSARYMDAAIGRFTTVDPLAEKYYSISPYAYVGNNPIIRTDPTGMDWVHRVVDGVDEYYYDRDVRSQDDVISKYGEKGGVTHVASGTSYTKYNKDGSISSQYTFFNDGSGNNEYGAVVDAAGNLMADDQIIYGKDFTIFGTSDNSVNAETLHKNYFNTSYTGPNNPKTYGNKELGVKPVDSYQYLPRNLSEYPAMLHDLRYDAKGAKGPYDAIFEKKTIGADIKLAIGSAGVMMHPSVPAKDRARAAAVAAAFDVISVWKFVMAIW
ncbi:hypothetical protein FACS1894169_12750 [Bacteroidia bacterium]|nr:hypothetical protein FACS1894169_12750 [Bacteroidia bacterium]